MTKLTMTAAKAIKVGNAKHELVVVPLFTNQALAGQSAAVDSAAGGVLQRAIDLGEAEGKLGKVTNMIGTESVARIVAVGCGDREKFDRDTQLAVTSAIGRSLAASKAKAATIVIDNVSDDADSAASFVEFLARDVAMGCYHYTATIGSPKPGPTLAKLSVAVGDMMSAAKAKAALHNGLAIGKGANVTRELVNLPGNVCTPTYLAKEARTLGRKYDSLSVSVLDEKKMESLGMGSRLSVGNGCDAPAKLIVI